MFGCLALSLVMSQSTSLQMPRIFSDHMVLQQSADVPIWGWDKPGQAVRVTGGWDGNPKSTRADSRGQWRLMLKTPAATGNANRLTVEGSETKVINDVMLGEVWVASGQSNMEWKMSWCNGGKPGMTLDQAPGNQRVRIFTVPHRHSPTVTTDFESGQWEVAEQGKLGEWSAVSYYFAQAIHRETEAPVGMIVHAFGGTEVELWIRDATMRRNPDLANSMNESEAALQPTRRWSTLFNGMVAPIVGFKTQGFLWYQGESNAGRAKQYATSFPMMIQDWRDTWGDNSLPFYFVQIAPFSGYGGVLGAELREAQRLSLATPRTGMVVTTDITDNPADIHPVNKFDVGERLARWALRDVYGQTIEPSGPLFRTARPRGVSMEVWFDHANGLMLTGDGGGFELAGHDKVWKPATAIVEGDRLLVTSPSVAEPVGVRYGWSNVPPATLKNRAGLPASPFNSTTWPWTTDAARW